MEKPKTLGEMVWEIGYPEEGIPPGIPGSNLGKTYAKRAPSPAKGTWEPWLFNKTWEALLSLKSWVAFGVYRSLCLRAKTSGFCLAQRGELAAEVGCADSAVQKAIAALIKLKLIDRIGGPARRGKLAQFKVSGYKRGGNSGYSNSTAAI